MGLDLIQPVWLRQPRSVYVHVPFCTQRCGYCNFALIAGRQDLVDSYLQALEREVATTLKSFPRPLEIETLFFGGGTPTFLQPRQVEQLVELFKTQFSWQASDPQAPDSQAPNSQASERQWEWTVEANPNDLTAAAVQHWTALGVTRFSLGAQSFRSEKLRFLERTHSGDDIRRACEQVLASGAILSLDLIFAVDNETHEQWTADLDAAIACQPHHISTYQLTFEKGTQFWNRLHHGHLTEADQDDALRLYRQAQDQLGAAGYEHYEVSNFARPGFRSRHNQVYWSGRPYLAFGPGAASYISGVRRVNHHSTTTYIKRLAREESPVAEVEPVDPVMRAREYFVFGMRRLDGIDARTFKQETRQDLQELLGPLIQRDVSEGFFRWQGTRLQLTPKGLYISDSLWPDYL